MTVANASLGVSIFKKRLDSKINIALFNHLDAFHFSKTVLTEDRISLKGVSVGMHKVRLTLINNLRNLMGPHHLEEGECLVVSPRKFFKEKCVWYPLEQPEEWNEDYCFVRFGR